MRASITITDSGDNRGVTMFTDVPDLPENDTSGPATPAAVMLLTIMALYECRGLELLGHHVLKGVTNGQQPSEVLCTLLEQLPHDTEP